MVHVEEVVDKVIVVLVIVIGERKLGGGKSEQENRDYERQLDRETEEFLFTCRSAAQLVHAQVEVEPEDGDPGEVAHQDKVEGVAQEAARVPSHQTGVQEFIKNALKICS